jgi:adenine specific DNA methylase Mod
MIGKSKKQIFKDMGNTSLDHFFRFGSSQFGLPTREIYEKMIEIYSLHDIKNYDDLTMSDEGKKTYNPQKTIGKPYKTVGKGEVGVYGSKRVDGDNKGDRHPTSIINHDMIYVFSDNDENKKGLNNELMEYSRKLFKFIGKTKKKIKEDIGDMSHFFTGRSVKQFRIPTKKKYEKLTEIYGLERLDYYLTYQELNDKMEGHIPTYNPQKTKGKPYKTKESSLTNSYYRDGVEYKSTSTDNKGDRHPSSILTHENIYIMGNPSGGKKTYNPQKTDGKPYKHSGRLSTGIYEPRGSKLNIPTENKDGKRHPNTILKFKNPHKPIHRTQKPVKLLEWLIKSYSNEGDLVLDFCMGSGSCGVACINIGRKFIGIEKDKEIFDRTLERIHNALD